MNFKSAVVGRIAIEVQSRVNKYNDGKIKLPL